MRKNYSTFQAGSRSRRSLRRIIRRKKALAFRVGPHGITSRSSDDSITLEVPRSLAELLLLCKISLEELVYQMGLVLAEQLMESEACELVGPYHKRKRDRRYYRWGKEAGYIVLGGQKFPVLRPRVRSLEGQEAVLQTYLRLQSDGDRQRGVLKRLLAGVSSRDYSKVLEDFYDAYGIAKSTVSRTFIRASEAKLKELFERDLSSLELVSIIIDGFEFQGHLVVVSLGIDTQGRKHILGLWEGVTENSELCISLLRDLVSRGLKTNRSYLFVIDGSKALKKGIIKVFGERTFIERCLVHKKRNVLDHLPKSYHREVGRMLEAAWNMFGYKEAKKELKNILSYLKQINPSAARSLEEGLEETLTLHRLGVPESLRRPLQSTNIIESGVAHARK